MRRLPIVLFGCLLIGCQTSPDKHTIATLRAVPPDLNETRVDDSLLKAMAGYRQFLDETPAHAMAPEAMRRLADLQIEKEYGVLGGTTVLAAPDAPTHIQPRQESLASPPAGGAVAATGGPAVESERGFEERATRTEVAMAAASGTVDPLALPGDAGAVDLSGPLQAIATYKQILAEYPWYERNDQVLYQMARAYDELARPEEAMEVVERLIAEYPDSRYVDEVYFRRGEYHFVRRQYLDAENAYQAVVRMGDRSPFYELSLYKLGWSFYKQELYEEALHQYMALLDYKHASGYDFDAQVGEAETEEAEDERRVADTFRVVSLSFSNLGGPEVLREYFSTWGQRGYEDRIYRNLAEFHVEKRRFNDAAAVYQAFVEQNPFHKVSPHFSMRVAEVYAEGNFPLLVVEAKRDFAVRYGVNADYWHHFDIATEPEVLEYLKTNLMDLAGHYHALYQIEELEEERPANYAEALRWYGEFLNSFPEDGVSPSINYQLADLLLEHEDFAEAAREYERTAYGYPSHEQSAAAGYAAVYAHRQQLKVLGETGGGIETARLATVESSLRFAEAFPEHLHAVAVLAAAAEDLYDMRDFERAITAGQWLIDRYPQADAALRRTAWTIVAHASLDLGRYPEAERAYAEVLALVPEQDEERQAITDNLAAAIYKQGEAARDNEDYAAAAEHFLRIKIAAPASEIRAAAEYDAAAALIYLESWVAAAEVLEDFRAAYPDHELRAEATRQLAVVYEKAGELSRSAAEYERVANNAEDPKLRSEAMLVAGDLYEQASNGDEALRVYLQYVDEFPDPLPAALEIRFKIASMYESGGERVAYLDQLRTMVDLEARAGAARTDRTRFLAGRSALVLARPAYDEFVALDLVQPFERSLAEKQRRMDVALETFEALLDYQVGQVTAAATYYMAEIYRHFNEAMLASERPAGLSDAELQDYELVIEEEAYPFEELSIEVHRKNLELMRVGVYNEWVARSLDELSVLMPGRYAKRELSSGFVGSIEQYAYRSPMSDPPDAETAGLSSTDNKGAAHASMPF